MKYKYGNEYKISCYKVKEIDVSLLEKFKCEYTAISRFVKKECMETQEDVTYFFIDEENNRIIGVCAISCSGISTIDDLGGVSYRTSLPSVEIDYFAIDEEYRNIPYSPESTRYDTLSKALFFNMLVQIRIISKEYVGATHIQLYSVPKAVHFYERCGFEPFDGFMLRENDPHSSTCKPMYCVI